MNRARSKPNLAAGAVGPADWTRARDHGNNLRIDRFSSATDSLSTTRATAAASHGAAVLKRWVLDALRRLGYEVSRVDAPGIRGRDLWKDVAWLLRDSPSPTCFDVGANLGQTTELLLRSFPAARIWAFEPVPDVFSQLREATANDPRVSCHPIARCRRARAMG